MNNQKPTGQPPQAMVRHADKVDTPDPTWKKGCTLAKQIITKLIDDVDGGAAAETVRFALDGVEYTIDLSKKNAAKLRTVFKPYADAGVKMAPARRRAATADENTVEGRARIRAWARANGYELGDKGRISAEIAAAYRSRNQLR